MAKVLAVDDDPDVLTLLEVVLRQGGHLAATAQDAESALAVARQARWDLILLDVMMPGRDGWSVLETLKSDPGLADVPVVMVTARGEARDKLTGGVGGALRHITKPFSPAELLAIIEEVLNSEESEPVRRRGVQRESMSQLARLEAGRQEATPAPRLSGLSHLEDPAAAGRVARGRLDRLTDLQRELVVELGRGATVRHLAQSRQVARSSLYAHLRRIHRKLGTNTVEELAALAKESGLL